MSHQGRARVTLATIVSVLALSGGLALVQAKAQATTSLSKKAPGSLRLYIFDCGTIHTTSVDAYSLKTDEVGSTEMSIPCIMVAHPRGTLMWDNGDIPDRAFKPGGGPAAAGVVTQAAPLLPQLAAVGYAPADITYLAMSHYHGDHVANANAFAGSIWLVRKVERDRMFSDVPIPRSDPANYNLLKNSKTVIIDQDEYRRLRGWKRHHQVHAGPHPRPPGAVSEAGPDRPGGAEWGFCTITRRSARSTVCRWPTSTRSRRRLRGRSSRCS